MQKTITIEEALGMFNDSKPDLGPRTYQEGQVMQQGDIYIHPVPFDHPHGPSMGGHRQLAIGNTKGSRHMLEGDVEVFVGTKAPADVGEQTPLGPMFIVKSETARAPHPEHPEWIGITLGAYQVTHQINALTGERVND
jgi:hypothetical protein